MGRPGPVRPVTRCSYRTAGCQERRAPPSPPRKPQGARRGVDLEELTLREHQPQAAGCRGSWERPLPAHVIATLVPLPLRRRL